MVTVFAVRGIRPSTSSSMNVTPMFSIFDTLDEAKAQGEAWIKDGCNEISVWQQVACPTLQQTVLWA